MGGDEQQVVVKKAVLVMWLTLCSKESLLVTLSVDVGGGGRSGVVNGETEVVGGFGE